MVKSPKGAVTKRRAGFPASPASDYETTDTATSGTVDQVWFAGVAGQTYVLADNVERLILLGTEATNGTGNAAVQLRWHIYD